MDLHFIAAYEAGETDLDEIIENFQQGINDNSVWRYPGFYSEMAERLINDGLCHEPEETK